MNPSSSSTRAQRPALTFVRQGAYHCGKGVVVVEKAGVPVAEIGCTLFAVYGVLSTYIGAQKTGQGAAGDFLFCHLVQDAPSRLAHCALSHRHGGVAR
ncbi:hypothetical protein QF001_008071 [Paraburkholderia youngii]|uniref:hypothetical protein n=1 Tax=Paraburkholderia youngii TaxID=2782701 RepID=UPI003D229F96